MTVITKDLAITTKDDRGNQVLYHPFTTVDNVDNAVATVNGVKPDSSGNVQIPTYEPIYATVSEATEGTDNTKIMTPLRVKQAIVNQTRDLPKLAENNQFIGKNQFIGEINQGVVKKVEGDIPNLSNIGADVLALTLTSGNAITLDIAKIFGGVSGGVARVCIITLSGELSAIITWTNCKMCIDAPTKTANKTTIVTFLIDDHNAYLVSVNTEV